MLATGEGAGRRRPAPLAQPAAALLWFFFFPFLHGLFFWGVGCGVGCMLSASKKSVEKRESVEGIGESV